MTSPSATARSNARPPLDRDDPGEGSTAVGHHHLAAFSDLCQVVAQSSAQLSYTDFHGHMVTRRTLTCAHGPGLGSDEVPYRG